MKKGLGKFCISVVIVLSIVAVSDVAFGLAMDWMMPQLGKQSDLGKTYFSLNDVNTPVVILGSSRASHHYDTHIIGDSLGKSSYNLGRDGYFFSYNYCLLNSILDRYSPELIIWENNKDYLTEEHSDQLVALYPYYRKNKWVTQIFRSELSWEETSRLACNMYRYNSLALRMVMGYLKHDNSQFDSRKGYLPLKPKDLKSPLKLVSENGDKLTLSQLRVDLFREVLARVQEYGVKLVVVDSPKYKNLTGSNEIGSLMSQLCAQYGALFLDNTQLPDFLAHPEYFNDGVHLNEPGATLYTSYFLEQIGDYVRD